jgi:hypothetical protein
LSKLQNSHIKTFINLLEYFLMERRIIRSTTRAIKCTSNPIVKRSKLCYWTLSGGGKFRDRLAVSKQITLKFHMERFSLKKLNEVEGKEQ